MTLTTQTTPADSLENLVKAFRNKETLFFKKNDVVFSENEPAKGVYFIKEGKIKIIKARTEKDAKILRFGRSGDFLGLHSVINGNHYSNSAIAIENTETYFIEREDFLKKINGDINKKLLVMKFLCERIGTMETQMSGISGKSASGRLAEAFIFLLDTYGTTKDDFINIRLSSEELAQLTGASKGYLVKIISEFNNNKLIYTAESRIKILDKARLCEIAGS